MLKAWGIAAILIGLAGCSHGAKQVPANASAAKGEEKREALAERSVEQTEEDEHFAPQIQKEMNAIFFQGKAESPGGLDAFAPDRLQDLEIALAQSERPAIRYFRANREYFDRFEDAGGGFRVVANAARLVPYRRTKAGRRKLFVMDTARVREMIANPCFSALEDCGEYASDAEENTPLLEEWTKKYPEEEYRAEREKVLRNYLAVLEKYQKRVVRKKNPKKAGAKQAALIVGSHIRGVALLLKD